ncbi:MAG: 50S ribosomal protein L35 [Oscillospiraceae bacterium]|nr:50S ribosomal protein L35 [Oscillospiraceae bacterium]
MAKKAAKKYKLKTHSGAKKRFNLTKNGKVKRAQTKKNHLLNGHGKTTKSKRNLRGTTYADKTNVPAIKRMIPYK